MALGSLLSYWTEHWHDRSEPMTAWMSLRATTAPTADDATRAAAAKRAAALAEVEAQWQRTRAVITAARRRELNPDTRARLLYLSTLTPFQYAWHQRTQAQTAAVVPLRTPEGVWFLQVPGARHSLLYPIRDTRALDRAPSRGNVELGPGLCVLPDRHLTYSAYDAALAIKLAVEAGTGLQSPRWHRDFTKAHQEQFVRRRVQPRRAAPRWGPSPLDLQPPFLR